MTRISMNLFFLDPEFRPAEAFGAIDVLGQAQSALGVERVGAQGLAERVRDPAVATVVMGHGGSFPAESCAALLAFLHRGGDLIWLGGQPLQREWVRTERGWERGDPLDSDYPECPFERHTRFGIAPLWVAPASDLHPARQKVAVSPEWAAGFGAAATFFIAGQTCQLMPFGAGRKRTIATVVEGASTDALNDVVALVEPGHVANIGGGRMVACGFLPEAGWSAEFMTQFVAGLGRVLDQDRNSRLQAGMTLGRMAVRKGESVEIQVQARAGRALVNPVLRIQDAARGFSWHQPVESLRADIQTRDLAPGTYRVRLHDQDEWCGLQDSFAVLDLAKEHPAPRVFYAGPYAALEIRGKPRPLQTYLGHASQRTFETIVPGMRDAGIHLYHFFEGLNWGWLGPGKFDWSRHDWLTERLLQKDPEAYFFPHIGLAPPTWWVDSHPESMWHHEPGLPDTPSSRGRPLFASYYDPAWRRDTTEAMASLIKHSLGRWYGNRILGFIHMYGGAGEWGEEPKDGLFWVDHHPALVRWFRDWLKRKYGNDENLGKSWKDTTAVAAGEVHINDSQYFRSTNHLHRLLDHPEKVAAMAGQVGPKTLSQAKIPNFFRRRIGRYGIIRDPGQVRDVIDFLDCYREGYALLHRDFAAAFKSSAGSRALLIGTYSGYYFSGPYEIDGGFIHAWYPQFLDAAKDMDLVISENFYHAAENPTGDAVCQCAHESHRLHHKVYLQGNDQRTCLTKLTCTRYGTPAGTLPATLGSMKRNWVLRMTRGAGVRWFDFAQGYYDHPEIVALLKRLQEISTELIDQPNPAAFDRELARCAMFYSPTSHLYTVIASNYLRRIVENQAQRHFNRYGIPSEIYFSEDLAEVPQRRVYLFLNCFYLTKGQRRIIDTNLKRNGNVLIWLYGQGILDEDGFDVAKASAVTGFDLAMAREWRKLRIDIRDHQHVATRSLEGHDLSDFGSVVADEDTSPEMDRICPQLFVSAHDAKAQPLGVLEGTDRIGFAVKDCGTWKSVYASAAVLPARVMRGILAWAGIETMTDGLDNFYTNGDLVGLNSLASGYQTIRFPADFKIRDLLTDEIQVSRNREVRIWVRRQDTFLGQVQKTIPACA